MHMRSIVILALVLTAVAAGAGCAQTPSAAAAITQADYATAHALVEVGAGRRLNIFCAGSGSPAVIFDSGSGLAGWDWLLVHPAVAQKTTACVYDRAGFGFSDAASRPGTSAHAVDDLHALLRAAGVPPPYVLVGHSYGGANVQLYAYRHHDQVAGLVLVDASHEDEASRLDAITQGKFAQLTDARLAGGEQCRAVSHTGFVPGSPAFAECVGEAPPLYGRALAAAYIRQQTSPAYWDAAASEATEQVLSDSQLRQARTSFGSLPLIYLTHGVSPYLVPGQPQSELNKVTEIDIVQQHDAVARLSSGGHQRVIAGAAHSIHIDKPQAVIDAIVDVLAQARQP